MTNEQHALPTLYLAADENMQLQLTCYRLMEFHDEEFGFLIRANCVATLDNYYARNIPIQFILGLSKSGNGMSLELDLTNIPKISASQIKKITDCIQANPAYIKLVTARLNAIEESNEIENFYQAGLAKKYFLTRLPSGITHYSINRKAKKMFWLYKNDSLISNLSPFRVDEKGGLISYTVQVGFSHELLMQCYNVECMMHIFNDDDELGYYFELYLDQDDFHHQILYQELPDLFIENKAFLYRILQHMQQCESEQFTDYLQDLIVKFKASI